MKSKLFGLNAKLALALLAISGAMFTSCYESDKEDVYIPKTPELPAAVYTITGTVTDIVTGEGVTGATVTFTPASGGTNVSATTKNGGYSEYLNVAAVKYNVQVTATGYTAFTEPNAVDIKELEKGQSAAYVYNVVLHPTTFKPEGVKAVTIPGGETPIPEDFTAEDHISLDIVNNDNIVWPYSIEFIVDKGGAIFEGQEYVNLTRAISNEMKTYITNYLKGLYNPLIIGNILQTGPHAFTFNLLPNTYLESLTVTTKYKEVTHQFIYGEETYTVKVKSASAYELNPTAKPVNEYHGHAHGNGNNAGGGIIAPIN